MPPHTNERPREPVYLDDLEAGKSRYPPAQRQRPQPFADERHRPRRDYEDYPEQPRPRRRMSPRDMRRPEYDDESPPPRRRRRPAAPQDYSDDEGYQYLPRREQTQRHPRRPRDEGYMSDNRHNRPRREYFSNEDRSRSSRDRHRDRPRDRDRPDWPDRPRERPIDDRPDRPRERPRERLRDDRRERERRPRRPDSKDSRWKKEAFDMFKTYAVPAIKAEGGKWVSKEIGNFIAKQGR